MDNYDDLVFDHEYTITHNALFADTLVIRKNADAIIKNDIGAIFRTHNIFEYKSPDDELNIDSFFKVFGYACLYKSVNREKVNEVDYRDITISLVRQRKPIELFKTLKDSGFGIELHKDGIYYINSPFFNTQIIVSSELNEKDHLFLKSIEKDFSAERFFNLVSMSEKLQSTRFNSQITDIVNFVITAYRNEISRWKEDNVMGGEALMQLMKPEIDESNAKARAEGIAEGIVEGIAEGIEKGREEKQTEFDGYKIKLIRKYLDGGYEKDAIKDILDLSDDDAQKLFPIVQRRIDEEYQKYLDENFHGIDPMFSDSGFDYSL